MDGRRPAQAGAQNPAYRPARPPPWAAWRSGWNVFVEDRVAFLHRSWTGHGVLEASFALADDNWRISAAVAESDTTHMRALSDHVNRVLLELVLSAIVLGEPAAGLHAELVALLLPPDRPPPPAGLIEHSILGRRHGP